MFLVVALGLGDSPLIAAEPEPDRTVLPVSSSRQARIGTELADSQPAFALPVRAPSEAPNVLLVMSDDVGFGVASTFGGPVPTPALDRLARRGLTYNRFHTTAMCSPTRAALLTGRNHHAVGHGAVADLATGYPGYDAVLPRSAATVAEILRLNGFSTALFGKHHNQPYNQMSQAGPFDLWPSGLGFEYFFGFLGGDTNQWHPTLYRNNVPVDASQRPDLLLDQELADEAIRWLHNQKAAEPDKPFFLYYAQGSAHAPHAAPEEWIERFKGQFDQGWDALREESFARQRAAGVIPASAELTPRPDNIPAWDSLSREEQRIHARMMEVYAAMVAYQDQQFGRLIDELERMGELDNTLVLFIEGDNGGSAEGGVGGTTNELAHMVNGLVETPAMMTRLLPDMGGPRTYMLYSVGWAWATDTPFQWTKQIASHLGGTRNGLVVAWPQGIEPAEEGPRSQYHHVIDIAPTILDVVGLPQPEVVHGVTQQPVDGISMRYSFADPDAPGRRLTQYYEMLGHRGIYHQGWQANTVPPAGPWEADDLPAPEDYEWELYHLDEDYSQARNLAREHPERLRELQALWLQEAERNQVLPLDNRNDHRRVRAGYPSPNADRRQFTYWGPDISVPTANAPMWAGRPFSITADVTLPKGRHSGPILAHGSWFGGWAFYLNRGRLAAVSAVSHYPEHHYRVMARKRAPAGRATVRFDFEPDERQPGQGGTLRISIDGEEVASGHIERTIIIPAGLGETFDIGVDTGAPVTEDYPVQARFAGEIHRVEVTLH